MNRQRYFLLLSVFLVQAALFFSQWDKQDALSPFQMMAVVPPKPKFDSWHDSLSYRIDSLQLHFKDIMGFRFAITGDFDGDKLVDTLVERFTDSTGTKEVAMYNDGMEYEDALFRSRRSNYLSFIEFKQHPMQKIGGYGGTLGFHYVENAGDLNGDGRDEVLVLANNGDFSNLNHCSVYSFADTGWVETHTIGVWEWMFPSTPSVSMLPGMFGNYDIGMTQNDSIDKILTAELQNFRFIKRRGNCWIEYEEKDPIEAGEEVEFATDQEFDHYHQKRFEKVKLDSGWYYRDNFYPAVYYKMEEEHCPYGGDCLLPINVPASRLTVRVNICHKDSPFLVKPPKINAFNSMVNGQVTIEF